MMNNNNTLSQEQVDTLIVRYSTSQLTEYEMYQLNEWIHQSRENLTYYHTFRNLLDHRHEVEIQTANALQKVFNRIQQRRVQHAFTLIQKIAALLFLPLLIGTLWLIAQQINERQTAQNQITTIISPFGSVSNFTLPDGSKVWLNAGSRLEFPDHFSKAERQVKLVGEAYFEVHSDENSPFIVETPMLSVKATGTRFHVMSYQKQQPSVSLAEGKVMVYVAAKQQLESRKISMFAGQHISLDTNSLVYETETGDTYKHIAWKDGKLIFRNDLMTDIMLRISLQYNVDIEITDPQIKQNRYRATFENESLTELLDLLNLATPFSYHEINPVPQSDGSFSRRKVIISRAINAPVMNLKKTRL